MSASSPVAQVAGPNQLRTSPAPATRRKRGGVRTHLAVWVIAGAVLLHICGAPAAEPWDNHWVFQLALMSVFHLLSLAVTVRILRGYDLLRLLPAFTVWFVSATVVMALGRPTGLPYALAAAVLVLLTAALVGTDLESFADDSLRKVFTTAFVLCSWGLLVNLSSTPGALAGQLVPFLAAWLLASRPEPRACFRTFYRLAGRVKANRLSAVGITILGGNLVYKWFTGSPYPSVVLAGISVQPFLFAAYFGLGALALRILHTGHLGRAGWGDLGIYIALFVALGELGTLALILTALALHLFCTKGLKTPDLRRLVVLSVVGFLMVSVLGTMKVPAGHPLHGVASRFQHIGARQQARQGKAPLPELVRVDLALVTKSWMGRASWSRKWLLSSANTATKDYALACLLLAVGHLGLIHVLLAYRTLSGKAVTFILKADAQPAVRHLVLIAFLFAVSQVLIPVASGSGVIMAVGVPLIGIARGGSQTICLVGLFLPALAALQGTGQRGGETPRAPAPTPPLRTRMVVARALMLLALLAVPGWLSWRTRNERARVPAGRLEVARLARWRPEGRKDITDSHGRTLATNIPVAGERRRLVRVYPYGEALAPVVGVASTATRDLGVERFLTLFDISDRTPSWPEQLMGDSVFLADPAPSATLTIAADAQREIFALQQRLETPSAVVLLDLAGDIKVLSSYPTYDPGRLLTESAYRVLVNRKASYLQTNRCLVPIPLGSTVKPLLWMLYREKTGRFPGEGWTCNGEVRLHGARIRCTGHHGRTTWESAIMYSCNSVSVRTADALTGYDLAAGFHQLELPGAPVAGLEARPGLMSAPDQTPGGKLYVGLGQTISFSPLAVCRSYAALVNRGRLPALRIVRSLNGKQLPAAPPRQVLDPRACEEMTRALRRVVTDGTASSAAGSSMLLGKTGSIPLRKGEKTSGLFVFANWPRPTTVGMVVLEAAGSREYHGRDAAGVAAEVFRIYEAFRASDIR